MKNKERFLESSKYSINEKTIFLIGCISETIFDKELFINNYDLKSYLQIFEDILKIAPYRDYLYAARPQLLSRLIRDLFYPRKKISLEEQQLITKTAIEAHLNFIYNTMPKLEEKAKHKNKNETTMLTDLINLRKPKNSND